MLDMTTNTALELPDVEYRSATDKLTGRQRLAMMSLYATPLAKAIVSKMRANGERWPSQMDFLALREAHLTFPAGFERSRLTEIGRNAARTLARELARKYEIHAITYEDQDRGTRAWCPCGWQKFVHNAQPSGRTTLMRWAGMHIDCVPVGYRYPGETP
jgi:hypothetical protein